jgi:hypothetical protein
MVACIPAATVKAANVNLVEQRLLIGKAPSGQDGCGILWLKEGTPRVYTRPSSAVSGEAPVDQYGSNVRTLYEAQTVCFAEIQERPVSQHAKI